jgi:hypothetical protein
MNKGISNYQENTRGTVWEAVPTTTAPARHVFIPTECPDGVVIECHGFYFNGIASM